jgi:hypothetical protein
MPTATTNNEITNYMEQRLSREVNSYSAIQEIPRLLWNPKVHHYIEVVPSLQVIEQNFVYISHHRMGMCGLDSSRSG